MYHLEHEHGRHSSSSSSFHSTVKITITFKYFFFPFCYIFYLLCIFILATFTSPKKHLVFNYFSFFCRVLDWNDNMLLLCGVYVPLFLFPLGKHLMSFVFMGVKIVKHVILVYCFCRRFIAAVVLKKGLSCYFYYAILNAKINFPMLAFPPLPFSDLWSTISRKKRPQGGIKIMKQFRWFNGNTCIINFVNMSFMNAKKFATTVLGLHWVVGYVQRCVAVLWV